MSESSARYAELNRYVLKNDYDKIIKCANKLLHSQNDDIKAFHCKIVALINLDRFEDVLTAFAKFPNFATELVYEKAYSLYRLNKVEEALNTIDSSPDQGEIHFQELKAQIYYRQENFEESYDLYKNLVKQTADEYDDERKTNLIANIANLVNHQRVIDLASFCPDRSSVESYEILFNTACYLMYLKNFTEAEFYLSDAEKCCVDSFDEDTPQEEIDGEVNVIKTQLACCKHFQKKESQALNIYKGVLDKKPSDYSVIAVANNNTLAVNKNKNFFELKKKMKALQNETLLSKLTSIQKRAVITNINQINALNAPSKEEALKICNKLLNEQPDNVEQIVLLKAAIFMKNKNLESAVEILEDHLKKSTGSKLKMGLAISQMYLNMGKYDKASEILKSLGEDMFYPGVVSALVTIMIAMGDTAGASQVLQSAVDWNNKNKKQDRELTALWVHASDLHLKRGQLKLAAHSLKELLKIKPNDPKVLSKLTIAYSKIDPTQVHEYFDRIQSDAYLKPNLDINQLESSSWMMGLKAIKKVTKDHQSPGTPFVKKSKNVEKKKKKKRLPKNYNPDVTPDPERWLPKRERSNYKRKKDRRNKDIGKGSQGAVSSNVDQFDITKMSRENKDKNPPPTPEDRKHQPHKLQQRKKKKGGKW